MKKRILSILAVLTMLACLFCLSACGALPDIFGGLGGGASTLATPELVLAEDTNSVSWEKVNHALKYTVSVTLKNGSEETFSTKETTFDFDQNNIGGRFSVKVKAIGDGTVNKSSDWSELLEVNHIHKFLSLENEGSSIKYSYSSKTVTISFTKLANAVSYEMKAYLGENELTSISLNNADYTEKVTFPFAITSTGTYVVKYVIKGDGEAFEDSDTHTVQIAIAPLTPVSSTAEYDKKTAKDLVFSFNATVQPILSVSVGEQVLDSELYAVSRADNTVTLSHSVLDALENGNNVIYLKTDFDNVPLTVAVSDSRTAYTKETSYSIKEFTSEDLVVELFTNGYNVTALTIGENDVDDFTFDKAQNKLTIGKTFLATLAQNTYTVTVVTENGNVEFTLNVSDAESPYLNVSGSTYTKGSNETRVFVCNNLHLDFYNSPYLMSTDPDFAVSDYTTVNSETRSQRTFTLKTDYLEGLEAGEYTYLVDNKKSPLVYTLKVVDTTLSPYNVRIDFDDNGSGVPYVCWDYKVDDITFVVQVGSTVKQTSDRKIAVSELTSSNTFTVTVSDKNYDEPTQVELTVPNTIFNAVDYSKKTYTYLGVTHNAYITSLDEAENMFEYIVFNRTDSFECMYPSAEQSNVGDDIENLNKDNYVKKSFLFQGQQKAMSALGSLKNKVQLIYKSSGNYIEIETSTPVADPSTGFDFSAPVKSSNQTVLENTDKLAPCYESYTSNRTDSSALPIDSLTKTQNVETSSQLYYAVEQGVKPVCKSGSDAEYIYDKARKVCKDILDDRLDDYTKVHYIYDWLCFNVTYDNALLAAVNGGLSSDASWMYSGFYLDGVFGSTNANVRSGIAVCDGISKAFVLLTRIEGIESIRVEGYAGGNHAWNKVKINGEWYACDATWGDTATEDTAYLSHAYLLCSESSLRKQTTRTEENVKVLASGQYTDFYNEPGDNIYFVSSHAQLKSVINSMNSGDIFEIYLTCDVTFTTSGTTFSGSSMQRGTDYILIKR